MNSGNISGLLTAWCEVRSNEFLTRNHLNVGVEISQYFLENEQFIQFRHFISGLSCEEFALLRGEHLFLKALVLMNFHEGHYSDAIRLIKNGTFQDPHEMNEIWEKCHYRIAEMNSGRPLNAVGRCRVRKRFPPPPSICNDGVPPPHRRLESSFIYEQSYHHPVGQALDLTLKGGHQSQPTKFRGNLKSKPKLSRNMYYDQAIYQSQSTGSSQNVMPYGYGNSSMMLPNITASPGTKAGVNWCAENVTPYIYGNGYEMLPNITAPCAQELSESGFESHRSEESVQLEYSRSNLFTPAKAVNFEQSWKPDVNYIHQRTYKGSNPLPQEKVTLHYFSTDVKYSWHPYRVNYLFDICQQEMIRSHHLNPLVGLINSTGQNLKNLLNCPFPPNVSLIPVKRIKMFNPICQCNHQV